MYARFDLAEKVVILAHMQYKKGWINIPWRALLSEMEI